MALALFPGLGFAYLGYPRRGLLQICLVGTLVTLVDFRVQRSEPILTLLLLFVLLYGFVDTYRRSILLSEAFTGLDSVPPSEAALTPKARIGVGVILVIGGVLALLNVRFGISLAWLLNWWPLLFVLLGVLLLFQALKDRAVAHNLERAGGP